MEICADAGIAAELHVVIRRPARRYISFLDLKNLPFVFWIEVYCRIYCLSVGSEISKIYPTKPETGNVNFSL